MSFGARTPETGTILVKKDGRFRWAYQAPERKDFIFDGTRLALRASKVTGH